MTGKCPWNTCVRDGWYAIEFWTKLAKIENIEDTLEVSSNEKAIIIIGNYFRIQFQLSTISHALSRTSLCQWILQSNKYNTRKWNLNQKKTNCHQNQSYVFKITTTAKEIINWKHNCFNKRIIKKKHTRAVNYSLIENSSYCLGLKYVRKIRQKRAKETLIRTQRNFQKDGMFSRRVTPPTLTHAGAKWLVIIADNHKWFFSNENSWTINYSTM